MKNLVVGIILIFLLIPVVILSYIVFVVQQPAPPAFDRYDVNHDGRVNSSDCNLVYRISRGYLVATEEMLDRCDVNEDGLINDKDAQLVFNAVLHRDGG